MLRSLPVIGLVMLLAAGCASPRPAPVQDHLWEGEMRILPGDTTFIPCGTQRKLQITGPGLDSLARRYAWLQTRPGQWIKTWCNGHLDAPVGRQADSLLVATSYAHMDAAVHCPLAPVDSLSGRYVAHAAVPGGQHTEQLEFLPNGSAVIITTTPSLHAEVDGTWGLNSAGELLFEETGKRYAFKYERMPGKLVRHLPNGMMVEYLRTGPAERLSGAFGRTARWLAAVSTSTGHSMRASDLRPMMRLDSLFPDTTGQLALRRSAADTLGLDHKALTILWPATETVGDAVQLMRHHLQPQR